MLTCWTSPRAGGHGTEPRQHRTHQAHETFDAHAVSGDNGPLIRTIDQFVLRFIKLQDTLGEQVLRAFASEVLAEPVSDLPLIDVLARLERYGVLDAAQWARWRALRNSLTHEYPDHPETRVAVLEEASEAAGAQDRLVGQLNSRLSRR